MALRNLNKLTALEHRLRGRLKGDLRFDPYTRVMYSTDGSNHQIEPLGVAFPRHADDLSAILEVCQELGISVLPRGAGTSLAGQTVGEALVLDLARHMNIIHSIDPETETAELGPGVVCAGLNQAASAHQLIYGPDPASADRATFGGMIANNATGAHSIQYGMSADHVLSADVVLSDATQTRFEQLTEERAGWLADQSGLEAQIYRELLSLRSDYAEAVRRDWPRTWRRASGYSLNYLTGYSPNAPPAWYRNGERKYPDVSGVNLAPILAGSEGTLAIIHRARVQLVRVPPVKMLVVLPFASVADACDATPGLLELSPSAVELIPRAILERAASIPAYARRLTFVEGQPEALLVVEFSGEDEQQVRAAAESLNGRGRLLDSLPAQDDLWAVRKVGLGLLMSVPGEVKPITFIEDVAVPVELLGSYVRQVETILRDHDTFGEWYAHASAGCLHLRPMVNLRNADGVRRMRSIADAVADVVISMRGSFSGEHGDGLSHSEFNAQLFGPELMEAFARVKAAFDPTDLLNPGKIIPSREAAPARVDESLRFGPAYSTIPVSTVFAYRREGDFAHAIEDCVGIGSCRKEDGVMCPSYQATREEMHLTRGRANALRAALSGHLPPDALTSKRMFEVLDLCLECKGCKAECPTGVDMARIKADFLYLYQQQHGVSLRSRFFGNLDRVSALAARTAGIVNFLNRQAPLRWLLEKTLGLARQRTLPVFSGAGFRQGFSTIPADPASPQVVLFVDTYTQSNTPQLGEAAARLLRAAGYRPTLVARQVCCGRPMISKGLLNRARALAERNLDALAPYARAGVSIIGLEPSCLLTLRDEYLEFFPEDPRAEQVASQAHLIEEFLTSEQKGGVRPIDGLRFKESGEPVLLHAHCHAKSLIGSSATLEMLRATGAQVEEIPSGCCGMAGSFGYEAEHYELSMQIAELKLLPAVREGVAVGSRIAAHGVSCRAQIWDGAEVRARHPVEVLAERLLNAV